MVDGRLSPLALDETSNMNMKTSFLLGACLLLLTGCGTIATRTSTRNMISDTLPAVYAATSIDAGLISATSRPEFGSAGKRAAASIAGLIDLPISIATDTLFLPYDLYKSSSSK